MIHAAVLEALATNALGHALLIFLRIGAVFFFLPMLGANAVPMRIRLAIALAVSLILAPLIVDPTAGRWTASTYLAAAAAEVFTGLLFGFAIRSIFWAISIAGTMASQAISLSQILGNSVDQPTAAIGQIIFVAGLALATVLDFHTRVVLALAQSYDLIGLGQPVPARLLELWSVTALARLFEIAFTLSGPFLILAVLYNLCLGVVNKAMPQLMVAFVGAPAITWLGIVFLFLAGPVMLSAWAGHVESLSLIGGGR